jgi:large subunit ribosomal protein L9
MKVILKEDVPNLGKLGETVTVADGFGRNYLVPKGKAVLATGGNMRRIEHQKRLISKAAEKMRLSAEALATKLGSMSVTIIAQAGSEERLYGSITNRDIEAALRDQGVPVDRKQIHLEEPIKKLGIYQVPVKLGHDVEATLKVWVVPASPASPT